jgi:hypothetical protein
MDKHIEYFETKQEYLAKENELPRPSVAYTEDTKEVFYKGEIKGGILRIWIDKFPDSDGEPWDDYADCPKSSYIANPKCPCNESGCMNFSNPYNLTENTLEIDGVEYYLWEYGLTWDEYHGENDKIQNFVDDPEAKGCNLYHEDGDTITIQGVEYYVWYADDYEGGMPYAALTTTNDFNQLYGESLEENNKNKFTSFFGFMHEDYSVAYKSQGMNTDQKLVSVYESNSSLHLWIDDFPNKKNESVSYLLTTTNNYSELYNESLQADLNNEFESFFAILGNDKNIYKENAGSDEDYRLVKVEKI